MKIRIIGLALTALAVIAPATAEVLRDQDFSKVIHTAGSDVWPAVTGNNYGGYHQNNAFDGIKFSSELGKRWLSSLKDSGVFGDGSGKDGVYAQMLAPSAFLGRVYLKKYRFYLLSCGGNEAARAPKAWKVFGVPANSSDSSSWTELDGQSGYTDWTVPTEETANEFTIAEDKLTGAGFRAFRFVPLDSKARTWSGTNPDFGLMEIEFVVDVYRNVTIESDIADPFRMQGAFSPSIGTSFDGVTALTAPAFMEKGGKTYACAGHRIDEWNGVRWKTVEIVEDGLNSFNYEPAEDPNSIRRVVWLWSESAVPVDFGAVDMYKLFDDRGKNLADYAYGASKHSSSSVKKLFDGIDHGDSGDRWLGVGPLSEGACYDGVKNFSSSVLMAGDLFYIKNYTLYMLSAGGNEKIRVPTAWLLTADAENGRSSIDERTSVNWEGKSKDKGKNAYEFTPAHPEVGFSDVRFTPTASGVENPSSSTVSVGLMELRLNVNVANPPGTLRVYNGGDVLSVGFSVPDKTLLTESATITAPEYAVAGSGARKYAVTGYRLEKFNLAETAWELVEEVKDSRSYTFTPDGNAGYRLTWLRDRVGEVNPWLLANNESNELCIRNGNWEFAVEELEDGTLKMVDKGYRTGSGDLDLNVKILDGNGQEKVISVIGDRIIDGENNESLRKLLTSLVMPRSVLKIGSRPFRTMTSLIKMEIRCPELIKLGETAFARNTNLKTLIFDAPKLTSFDYGYTFYNVPLSDTDVSEWKLPALETVPQDAFRCETTAQQIARGCGVLTLPAVRKIENLAFVGHTGFAELRLGTETSKLSSIGSQAFADMAMTNLVIGSWWNLTVGDDVCKGVNGGEGIGSLVFLRYAPTDRTVVDALLAGHGSGNLATLKVSKDYYEWDAYVTPVSEIVDADVKAAAIDAGADGAWRKTGGEDYLALVWRISTGFRPKGTAVIFR